MDCFACYARAEWRAEWNEIEANHRAAAVALMDQLGWSEYLTISGSGSLPGNGADGYVFTLTPKRESK